MEQEQKKTTKELWLELGRLILILLAMMFKYCISSIGRFFVYLFSLFKNGLHAIRVWWFDKSTQEKIRSIRLRIRKYIRLCIKWTVIGLTTLFLWTKKALWFIIRKAIKYIVLFFIYLWKGTRWLAINLFNLIVHMKPTLIRMIASFREWRKQAARGRRFNKLRRQRRHEEFVRNGGIRGALERKTTSLKSSIHSYMEEDQSEVHPEAVTDDEIFREKFEQIERDNKAQVISKKFFSSIKNIVEEND